MRGNFGVRYVETELTASGYLATGGGALVTLDNKYRDVLPSFNLATNVTKEFLVRVAAAKVMSSTKKMAGMLLKRYTMISK